MTHLNFPVHTKRVVVKNFFSAAEEFDSVNIRFRLRHNHAHNRTQASSTVSSVEQNLLAFLGYSVLRPQNCHNLF